MTRRHFAQIVFKCMY